MSSPVATVINLVKTTMGAGILALPFAFKSQGVLLATLSILIAGLMTGIGLFFQAYAAGFLPKGQASFFTVSKITVPSLAVVFDLAIALKCFGVTVSYLVISGNLMPVVAGELGASGFLVNRTFWLVVALGIVGPLSFYRTLDSLKVASVIALSFLAYIIVLVIVNFLFGDVPGGTINWVAPTGGFTGFLTSLPLVIFAFTCAHNMFSTLNELQADPISLTAGIVTTVMSIAGVLYAVVGLLGYLSFGNDVSDNIISMYPQSIWSTFGRFAIVVVVIFSYPLMLHPARASVSNIIRAWRLHRSGVPREASEEDVPLVGADPLSQRITAPGAATLHQTNFEHYIVTIVLLVSSFVLALSVRSLELVLSFVGSTGATAISFILPGIFVYVLSNSGLENRLVSFSPRQTAYLHHFSTVMVAFGSLVMILCLGVNISRVI